MSRDPETPQGAVMIDGLNNRYGRGSRIMWPAMEKHKDTVENEIEQQVRIVQAAVARSVK
jgi:hypothetical protein